MSTYDDSDEFENGTDLVKRLRRELKQAQKERDEFRDAARNYEFYKAGIDLNTPQGKAIARLHEGELTAEALRQTAETYGIQIGGLQQEEGESEPQAKTTPEQQERHQAFEQARNLQQQSQQATATGEKMSLAEWQHLGLRDPEAAAEARSKGLVEMPDYIREHLSTTQASPF